MKQGWEYGILEDAVNKGSSNISLNKIKGDDGDFPVFGAKGFVQNVSFFQQEAEYLGIIKDGAGIGRVSRHPEKSSILATMQYILPKEGYDIQFINYFLNYVDFEKYRTGSTIPHIYFKDYKSEPFPLVTLPEQKRIVAKLDQAFEAIDKAKANVERNLQNAKDLFQSELNKIFSQRGDGWVEKVLNDIGQIQTGTTPPTRDKSNYGNFIPFVKPSHFNSDGSIDTGDCMLSKNGLDNGRLFPANSVLMVCIGATIGKTGFSEEPVSANQQINCLTPTKEHNPKLFYFGLISPFVQKQVTDIGKGAQATLPIINKSKWQKLKINIPAKKSIQDGIVIQLNDLRSQTVSLEKKYLQELDAFDELKKSILQKAFNGEL
ncbi:MAG: restriction endonuclease subunit S [FCB group bacterium]|nr:restriction endonuclease subunit S [FCB group bacterium]